MPFILSVIFGDQPKEKKFQIEIVQYRQLRKITSPENTHTHTQRVALYVLDVCIHQRNV